MVNIIIIALALWMALAVVVGVFFGQMIALADNNGINEEDAA